MRAQNAPADAWQALRAIAVPAPEAGLPYAAALQRAGMAERATQLRLGLLAAHVQALNGAPWPAPRTLGEIFDEAAAMPPPTGESALAQVWRQAFNRNVRLNWEPTAPPEVTRAAGEWTSVGPGAWASASPARVRAAVTLSHRGTAPITMPRWTLQLSGAAGRLFMDCAPLASASDAVGAGETRRFVCRADAADRHGLLARAAQGRPAAGDTVTLLPSHFESAATWTALAEAIGSASSINTVAWVERLAATGSAPPAPAGATPPADPRRGADGQRGGPPASAASALNTAAPTRSQPLPPPAWRTSFAVFGSLAALWLLVRLIYGRLDEETPARTVWGSLPWVGGLLVLAALVGSPWGQAAFEHASGTGLRNLALSLQAASERAPAAWGLPAMAARYGYVVMAAGAGVLFFLIERVLIVRGFSAGYVKTLSLLARGALFLVVAAGMGPPSATPLYFALLFYAGTMLVASVVVSWLLHALFEQLDDAGLSLPAALRRTVVGTVDFSGTAVQAEFWAWLLLAVVLLLMLQAWLPASWLRPAALLLALPLPALLVRWVRGLGEHDRKRLVRGLAREALVRAERVARRRS